jgi:hypothetical protein
MTNIKYYKGTYQYQNNVLINTNGLKLLIAKRSNTSKQKTPLFLVDKTTLPGAYVSSLYQLTDSYSYSFDFKGVKYTLTIDEAECIAEIK